MLVLLACLIPFESPRAGDLRLLPPDTDSVPQSPGATTVQPPQPEDQPPKTREAPEESVVPVSPPEPPAPKHPEPSAEPEAVRPPPQEKGDEVLRVREAELANFQGDVAQEDGRMRRVVQILDRGAAAQWLAGFISSPPLNCPLKHREEWIEAIIYAAERNHLPVCKEILGLTACIISIESGFRADPLAVDPSRGEDLASLMERAERDLCRKMGSFMSMPPVPQLYRSYKERYYSRLLACKTEGQIEAVARQIADELTKDAERLPKFLSTIVSKEIHRVTNVVRTKGSMQLNYLRARKVIKERGEQFTDHELYDYMYTVNGGVDVGVAALKPMFVQYAAYYAKPGDLSWLFFVGMDYNYGPFSSRNMMEQIRIRDLAGRKIALDGDFMHYDEKARPQERESETLETVKSVFPSIPQEKIIKAFLLEKDPHYVYTDLHKSIAAAHRERFGETPFAVIGDLWMGEGAKIKHGVTWKTRSYLNKLDRYLNSIPWDQ
jgi:hypothetical protein